MSLGPDWTSINSSNLDSAMYEAEQHRLSIRFKNGSVYHYGEVPQDVADTLATSTSPGAFLANQIKGQYPTERG